VLHTSIYVPTKRIKTKKKFKKHKSLHETVKCELLSF